MLTSHVRAVGLIDLVRQWLPVDAGKPGVKDSSIKYSPFLGRTSWRSSWSLAAADFGHLGGGEVGRSFLPTFITLWIAAARR